MPLHRKLGKSLESQTVAPHEILVVVDHNLALA
jgi:hypothetical protein